MAPMMTLERPDVRSVEHARNDAVGTDGLTTEEREDQALSYLATRGSRTLLEAEKRDIARWLHARRG